MTLKEEKQEYNKELKGIVKNAGFGGVGILFELFIRFLNNTIITQFLGAELYGLYVLASKTISLIGQIGQLGMQNTVMRFTAFYKGKKQYEHVKGTIYFGLKLVLIVAIILVVIVFIFTPFISDVIYQKPELKEILRILIFALPLTTAMTIVVSSLKGLKFIKELIFLTKIISPTVFTIILLVTFLLGYSLKEMIYGQLINVFMFFPIALFLLYKKYLKKKKKIKPKVEKKKLLKFAYPLYINSFMNFFSKTFPIFFMATMLSNKEIAIYNVCVRLTLITGFASTAFSFIFLPVLSNLYGKGDKTMIEKLNKIITKWIFIFTLLITLILFLYYEPVLKIFGKEFIEGKYILFIVIIGQLIGNSVGLAGNILAMAGRTKVILVNSIIMFVITFVSCQIFIPLYGSLGAAIAYSTSLILINIIRLIELYYFEKNHPYNIKYIKPIIASVLSFGVMFTFDFFVDIINYLEAILGSIIFFVTFVFLMWLFKLEDDDKFILDAVLHKLKINK